MKNQKELSWDEIRANFAEASQMSKENERKFAEVAQMNKEMAIRFKKTEKRFKETDKRFKETDKRFKETDKKFEEEHRLFMLKSDRLYQQITGISKSNGEFCEEYFVNSFTENPALLGEKFDYVNYRVKPYPSAVIYDEYDLIMRNGDTIALIEMKYKAGIEDVGKMFSKLRSYRANYPMFSDYKIYLCLASFSFPDIVREKAAKEGVVLIQQQGDIIEVVSDNVRTW